MNTEQWIFIFVLTLAVSVVAYLRGLRDGFCRGYRAGREDSYLDPKDAL